MCYTNILQILDLSKIPLRSEDRTWEDPLVIGGGPCVSNPEPLAPFFDLFYIGEGETVYYELMDLYKECKSAGCSRREFLEKAAAFPASTYRSFISQPIMKTVRWNLLIPSWRVSQRRSRGRW